jgi:hypothetical protein
MPLFPPFPFSFKHESIVMDTIFLSPTSILEPVIYPFADKFYPPAILIKHHVWFLPAADLFISLNGILYGVHQSYFNQSPLFQEVIHYGRANGIGTDPYYPIPSTLSRRKSLMTFFIYCTSESNDWNNYQEKTGSTSNDLVWIGTSPTSPHLLYNNLLFFEDDYYHPIFE